MPIVTAERELKPSIAAGLEPPQLVMTNTKKVMQKQMQAQRHILLNTRSSNHLLNVNPAFVGSKASRGRIRQVLHPVFAKPELPAASKEQAGAVPLPIEKSFLPKQQ
jgi:hypothetical protein